MYVTKEELADIVSQYLDRYRKIVAWYSQFLTTEGLEALNYDDPSCPYSVISEYNSYDDSIVGARFLAYIDIDDLSSISDYDICGLDNIIKKDFRVASITQEDAMYLEDKDLITVNESITYLDYGKLYFDMLASNYNFKYTHDYSNVMRNTYPPQYLYHLKQLIDK